MTAIAGPMTHFGFWAGLGSSVILAVALAWMLWDFRRPATTDQHRENPMTETNDGGVA